MPPPPSIACDCSSVAQLIKKPSGSQMVTANLCQAVGLCIQFPLWAAQGESMGLGKEEYGVQCNWLEGCSVWQVACGVATAESINEISACKNCEMAMVMRLCQ